MLCWASQSTRQEHAEGNRRDQKRAWFLQSLVVPHGMQLHKVCSSLVSTCSYPPYTSWPDKMTIDTGCIMQPVDGCGTLLGLCRLCGFSTMSRWRRLAFRGFAEQQRYTLPESCNRCWWRGGDWEKNNQPTDRPTNRPTNPPTDRPTNQPTNTARHETKRNKTTRNQRKQNKDTDKQTDKRTDERTNERTTKHKNNTKHKDKHKNKTNTKTKQTQNNQASKHTSKQANLPSRSNLSFSDFHHPRVEQRHCDAGSALACIEVSAA